MKANRGRDRAADWWSGGWKKKAAGNLIIQDYSHLSCSAPSCLLTHNMLKMKSSGSTHTQPLVRNGSPVGLIGRREMGGDGPWKKRKRDGGW